MIELITATATSAKLAGFESAKEFEQFLQRAKEERARIDDDAANEGFALRRSFRSPGAKTR